MLTFCLDFTGNQVYLSLPGAILGYVFIYIAFKMWINAISQIKIVKPNLDLFTFYCFCAHV